VHAGLPDDLDDPAAGGPGERPLHCHDLRARGGAATTCEHRRRRVQDDVAPRAVVGDVLHLDDGREEHDGVPDLVAAGLDLEERRLVRLERLVDRTRDRLGVFLEWGQVTVSGPFPRDLGRQEHRAAGPEAAAEVEPLDRRAEPIAHEIREPADLPRALAVPGDLVLGGVALEVAAEADVVVEPCEVERRGPEDRGDGVERVVRADARAELPFRARDPERPRAVVGPQRVVRQAKPDEARDARACFLRRGVQPAHLVDRVHVHLADTRSGRGPKRGVALAVPVHDHVTGWDAGPEDERELVLGARVEERSAPVEHTEEGQRVVRLHGVRDLAAREAGPERADEAIEVVLDRRPRHRPERGAVLACYLREIAAVELQLSLDRHVQRGRPPDCQLALVDGHHAILPERVPGLGLGRARRSARSP
jgi:hypothetical protein